ncbi:MAG TPA: response regulator [Ktedonobacteraceae bacterium]|nr:response regulator [Ktedonobacteraceae bacterium]
MTSDKSGTTTDNEAGSQTILIVEDDEDISTVLVQVLQEETPHAVIHVTDAMQALQVIHSHKPKLLILNYQLPDLNGLELADRLRSIEGLETVPTLMVSANPPPLQEIRQRKITFLRKPFDLSKLLTTIEGLLSEHTG